MSGRADVDAFVAAIPTSELREIAEGVRDLFREGAPNATEAIRYDMPAWQDGKRTVAFFKTAKAHLMVGFPLKPGHPDPHGLLQGSGKTMQHVKLKRFDDAERAALRDYLSAALNASD